MSAPVITQQPQPQQVTVGNNVTFTAAATGAVSADLYGGYSGVSYGSNPTDANGNVTVTFGPVSNGDQGNFFFAFRNAAWNANRTAANTTLSSSVALTVVGGGSSGPTTGTNPPTITGQPANAEGNLDSRQTFNVYATTSSGTLTYQWYFGGTAIPGANGSSYTVNAVGTSDSGSYYVVVGNGTGTVQSATVTLTALTYGGPGNSGPGGGGGGGGGTGGITYQDPSQSLVKFVSGGSFQETQGAEFARPDDHGTADGGTRVFEGAATNLTAFLALLVDGLYDHEYPGCGLDSFRVSDMPGNKRRVTLTFRGLMGAARSVEIVNSTVYGTFNFKTAVTIIGGGTATAGGAGSIGGAAGTVEFAAPQTEYRYVVTGSRPTTPKYTGVATPATRPIQTWNFQPPDQGPANDVRVLNRCNRFEVKRAGSTWEVSESWVRELTQRTDPNFVLAGGLLPYVTVINPEEDFPTS